MRAGRIRIGVVAPGSRIDHALANRAREIAQAIYPDVLELEFHPQCFLSWGHFAGDDETRARAFLEVANDESFNGLWFARGGYGSGRLAARVLPHLTPIARNKIYLGYSDAAFLLGGMYSRAFDGLVHGPMPADLLREGGDEAVERALAFLAERAPESLEPAVSFMSVTAAFNLTVLSHLIGTPLQPDLTGHVLMLEEVSEHMYRIDRSLFHLTSNPGIRRVAGIMLGRCSAVPPNDPDFGQGEEEVAIHWCSVSGIPYLGRADIGHDIHNKIVPFGKLRQ